MTSGIITSLLLILFVAGCVWLFSPKRKKAFDDAARLALDDSTEEHK